CFLRESAEAHARDVDWGRADVWVTALRADHDGREFGYCLGRDGEHVGEDVQLSLSPIVSLAAEADVRRKTLASLDQVLEDAAVERTHHVIRQKPVLAQFVADTLENVATPPDEGEVASQRVG